MPVDNNIGISTRSPVGLPMGGDDSQPAKPKLERSLGGRLNVPEGLTARQSSGGTAPRQAFKAPVGPQAEPDGGEIDAGELKADDPTLRSIQMQQQAAVNSAALAESTARSADLQARSEFLKSMAEMAAKNVKSAGESLKGLA